MMTDTGTSLDDMRAAIVATDREIVSLIARRCALAQAVGAEKEARGMPLCDPAREAAVLRAVSMAARAEGLDVETVRHIFWSIIGQCRRAQLEAQHG